MVFSCCHFILVLWRVTKSTGGKRPNFRGISGIGQLQTETCRIEHAAGALFTKHKAFLQNRIRACMELNS